MKNQSILVMLLLTLAFANQAEAAVKVVTTLPVYASIAQYVGGNRVTVEAISRSDEDAHFVRPKPSFAILLRNADLFVTTGLDLEIWAPVLVDKSGNRNIRDGQPGFVSASQKCDLCNSILLATGFYLFPCQHVFHVTCLTKEVANCWVPCSAFLTSMIRCETT